MNNTNKQNKQKQTQKLKFDWFLGHQADTKLTCKEERWGPQETQNSSNRIRTQPNQCFLFRFLFLCSQSVSLCFSFLNLFLLPVNASDGETVRPQDRDYVLHRIRTQMSQCFLFRFLFLCSQSVSICFFFPNLFLLLVSV